MKKYNILCVDDELDNLQLLARTLRKNYNVLQAESAQEALEILKNKQIDLIISDHNMPEMDGVELLNKVYKTNPKIVRILITAYSDSEILINAINSSKIYRYVKKPWNPEELLNIVNMAINAYQLKIDNELLIGDFKELFSGTIGAITEALDAKDSFTSGRSKRVAYYSVKMAQALNLENTEISQIELAGLLHDIGMIGVPENILQKEGKLNDEEFDTIKNHVEQGVKILQEVKQFDSIIEIIKHHHERLDGSGYPQNATEIPLGAQIISVADTYDSMVSDRIYRKGFTHQDAIDYLNKFSGIKFQKDIVKTFCAVINTAKKELEEAAKV